MLTEDYCSIELSKLLKEKGFHCGVKNYYSLSKESVKAHHEKKYGAKKDWNSFELTVSRPSQSLVMKWLRELYKIHIDIQYGNVGNHEELILQYWYEIVDSKGRFCESNIVDGNSSYEEAAEDAIKYCLQNLIKCRQT